MAVKDFVKNYGVTMMFGDFDDVDGAFTFEKKEEKKENGGVSEKG